MSKNDSIKSLTGGYFGSSIGTAVAITAAVKSSKRTNTIVSRSGRLDLVDSESLVKIKSSILLMANGNDLPTIDVNHKIMRKINKDTITKIISILGATHLFAEQGKIWQIGSIATGWFKEYYQADRVPTTIML